MNKLFTRISMALVGIAMAVGAGVAAGVKTEARGVEASETGYFDLNCKFTTKSDGTGTNPASGSDGNTEIDTYSKFVSTNGSVKSTISSKSYYYRFTGDASLIDNEEYSSSKLYAGSDNSYKFASNSADGTLSFSLEGSSIYISSVVLTAKSSKSSPSITVAEASSSTRTQAPSNSYSNLTYTYEGTSTKSVSITVPSGKQAYVNNIRVYYSVPSLVTAITLSGEGLGGTQTAATLAIASTDDSEHTIYATINDADDKVLNVSKTTGDDLVTIGGLTDGRITASGNPIKASFTVTGKGLTEGINEVITLSPHDGAQVSATLTINVFDGDLPVLVSVTVGGTATHPEQNSGDDFDPDGLTFTPVYNKPNANPETITGEDIVWNKLAYGSPITGTYTNINSSVTVTVPAEKVTVLKTPLTSTDEITRSDLNFGAAVSSYGNFTVLTTNLGSKAIYAGEAYIGSSESSPSTYIQFKSSGSTSGLITKKTGGKSIKSISVSFDSSTTNGRTVDIYGSNVAYSGDNASALYDNSTKGTKVTSFSKSSTDLEFNYVFTSNYKYIGIRSNSGALYLDSITIVWNNYYADEVANEIKTLAGGWDNNVETNDCASHYQVAKEMILTLSSEQLAAFTSESASSDIKSAKATYEHWCSVNGDETPYSGTIVSPAARVSGMSFNVSDSSTTLVIIVISAISLIAVSSYFVIRRRKENN